MYKHSKLYAVISYITWIGWLAAYLLRDKNDTLVRRHLNQALALNLISTVAGFLSRIGGIMTTFAGIVSMAAFILSIMGIIRAFQMSEEPLPLLGDIQWVK